MNAPPEANTEYSRGSGASRRLIVPRRGPAGAGSAAPAQAPRAPVAVAFGALLGALLVLISQFTTLYAVRSATSATAIRTVGTGANHAWAPIPVALVALALAFAAWRYGNRAALGGLVVLGVATLLIALLGDLPDARTSGLIGSSAGGYVQATSAPSAGLYMETLGAVLLLISGGLGLLILGPGPDKPASHAPQSSAEPPPPKDPLTLRAPEGRRWSAS